MGGATEIKTESSRLVRVSRERTRKVRSRPRIRTLRQARQDEDLAIAPATERPITLYLDVDGVLLGRGPDGTVAWAEGADAFLAFATAHFTLRWLTTHGRDGDRRSVLSHLAPFVSDATLRSLRAIEPVAYDTLKTEPLVADPGAWVWVDDAPLQVEMALIRRRFPGRWIECNTRVRPDDLSRVTEELRRILAEGD